MAEDIIEELWKTTTTDAEKPEENLPYTKEALDIESRRERLRSDRQNRKQRKTYAMCIFSFVCVYMIVALFIIILVGAELLNIDNSVLITMLTTTTANIIGLFAIVARYLFNRKK